MSKHLKVIVTLLVLVLAIAWLFHGLDYTEATRRLEASLSDAIKGYGINEKDLLYEKEEQYKSGRHIFLKIVRRYKVGRGFDAEKFTSDLKAALKRSNFKLEKSSFEKEKSKEKLKVSIAFKKRIVYELEFLKEAYRVSRRRAVKDAKIAIVLDDFGYNLNNLDRLFRIKSPLTISVLPNLPYSKRIAKEAGGRNFEVMLHLPLEPHGEAINLEEGTIMVDMPPQEVKDILARAIESVPGLKGISNHMGSEATESSSLMNEVFRELRKRNLYFLDNLVTDRSVCREAASEIGLRIAERSVFLDNESDEAYIERQIRHTADLAARTGWAIGVGHDRPYTIDVLAKVVPRLENDGFEFVYVSELVR